MGVGAMVKWSLVFYILVERSNLSSEYLQYWPQDGWIGDTHLSPPYPNVNLVIVKKSSLKNLSADCWFTVDNLLVFSINFLTITWTFIFQRFPVYTDEDQRLAVKNRDDAFVLRGPKKNGKYFIPLYSLLV